MANANELDFWLACRRMLEIFPQRPGRLSRETEAVQLIADLERIGKEFAQRFSPHDQWLVKGSVERGNWTDLPWLAFFDQRETTSAQKGVYPVIHYSSNPPVGIRIGLGVAATEFGTDSVRKATEVHGQLSTEERQTFLDMGFTDVVQAIGERISIGNSSLARNYAKGMIYERFVPIEELNDSVDLLNQSLEFLLTSYREWVDRKMNTHNTPTQNYATHDFLELMRWYRDHKIVFLSTNRQARYFISEVDDKGCQVERHDANDSHRATLSNYQNRIDRLRSIGKPISRTDFDNTVVQQMTFLQGADVGLNSGKQDVILLDSIESAAANLMELIGDIVSPQLYKPMILAVVVEGIENGELTQNKITFDWLLPRFRDRFTEMKRSVDESQLAEGFIRLAYDFFWVLSHIDTQTLILPEQPSGNKIRNQIRFAAFKEPYWTALQNPECRQSLRNLFQTKWNIKMNSIDDSPSTKPSSLVLSDAVENLIDDIRNDGFTFEPWQVATFVTALRTKPFVILAGVSGTGKSKLPALIAQHTGGKTDRISVRPDWTDSSEVLGYLDIQGDFRPGVFLEIARTASADPNRHFISIFDEMNLARVEYYFAEVLSCIEDRRLLESGGFESDVLLSLQLDPGLSDWQNQKIPSNLGVVGTVNMDESTHGFSRKVLDRAFTIELSEVNLEWTGKDTRQRQPTDNSKANWPIQFWHSRASRLSELNSISNETRSKITGAIELLKRINDSLIHSQLQVGYRIRDEIAIFLVNAEEVASAFRTNDDTKIDPLDLAIAMKILPRIAGGSNSIRRTLIGLIGISIQGRPYESEEDVQSQLEEWDRTKRPTAISGATLPRSAARLCLMWDRLESEGFTSYWL